MDGRCRGPARRGWGVVRYGEGKGDGELVAWS